MEPISYMIYGIGISGDFILLGIVLGGVHIARNGNADTGPLLLTMMSRLCLSRNTLIILRFDWIFHGAVDVRYCCLLTYSACTCFNLAQNSSDMKMPFSIRSWAMASNSLDRVGYQEFSKRDEFRVLGSNDNKKSRAQIPCLQEPIIV